MPRELTATLNAIDDLDDPPCDQCQGTDGEHHDRCLRVAERDVRPLLTSTETAQ